MSCTAGMLIAMQMRAMFSLVGALPSLVEMLRSPQSDVQEAAAAAVGELPYAKVLAYVECNV